MRATGCFTEAARGILFLSSMTQFNRNTWFRGGLRGDGWITPEYFGAKHSASVDDSAAFQAACDAMASDGGEVRLGPFQYRTDQLIVLVPGVSWRGVPDSTRWYGNHATRDHHHWTSGNSRSDYTLVENIIFGNLISNTGGVIYNTTNVRALYRNCSFNAPGYGDNLNGRIFEAVGASSDFVFEKCHVWQKSTSASQDAWFMDGSSAKLTLIGNYVHQGSNTASPVVRVINGMLAARGNQFDAVDHAFSQNVISVFDTTYQHIIEGNSFKSAFSGGKALSWSSGANITERANNFLLINMYGSGGVLASGSTLSLAPMLAATTSGTTVTVPTGFASYSLRFTGASPTVTLPTILFPGQELDLALYNVSGGPLGFSLSNVGYLATNPVVGNGSAASAKFRAMDLSLLGTCSWVQIGGWGSVAP